MAWGNTKFMYFPGCKPLFCSLCNIIFIYYREGKRVQPVSKRKHQSLYERNAKDCLSKYKVKRVRWKEGTGANM